MASAPRPDDKPHLSTLQQIFTFSSRSRKSGISTTSENSVGSSEMVSAPWLPPVIAALPRHATYGAMSAPAVDDGDDDDKHYEVGPACHHYGMLVIRVGVVLLAAVLVLVGLYNWVHPVRAGCTVEIMFRNTCGAVQTEINARVRGQTGGKEPWRDPHNNGTVCVRVGAVTCRAVACRDVPCRAVHTRSGSVSRASLLTPFLSLPFFPGTYRILSRDATHYQLERLTGSGSPIRYTDVIDLRFETPAPSSRGVAAKAAAGGYKVRSLDGPLSSPYLAPI